jgi:CRISPR-associated endonuclease Cas2
MPRRKSKEFSLIDALKKMKDAGLNPPADKDENQGERGIMPDLQGRIKEILNIYKSAPLKSNRMIYFVMYDIEENKVRNYIAKYLINKGCIRIQKSVFIADTERRVCDEIHKTLKEVQSFYKNADSIFIIPVSTDEIRSMKIIGQSIDFSLFLEKPNTLFF